MKVISLPYIFQVLYVLCFSRSRYQVSIHRNIGPLVFQLLLGLRDTSGELAASSLRALADLVPILGRDVVIGGRAKNYFRKGMPKVCYSRFFPFNC